MTTPAAEKYRPLLIAALAMGVLPFALQALGLSLIFSVGGIVNLAHGAFYALGAYLSVEITKYLGFGPAIVLSPAARHLLRALHPAPLLYG